MIRGQSLRHLKAVHARALRRALPLSHLIAASPPAYALSLLRLSPSPDASIFHALLRLLSSSSLHSLSLSHYALMRSLSLLPSRLSLPFALRSAASLPAPRLIPSLHLDALKSALVFDPFTRVSLADAYVTLGHHHLALKLFDETPQPLLQSNILLWNVAIKACCRTGDLTSARALFGSMPGRSLPTWNTLIDGFVKNGDQDSAVALFEEMPERNVVTWTTMISGFSQNGEHGKALAMFDRMLKDGFRPNDFTIVALLITCAKTRALQEGIRIHKYMERNGFPVNRQIGAALVDMYSKCGEIEVASRIFGMIEEKDLLSYSAMIAGCAAHGRSEQALRFFEDMLLAGIDPDEVVFLSVLTACSHCGMVERGLKLFDSMKDYRVEPTVKHYTCVVDLYGRAGRLNEALRLIESMRISADFVTWGALFSACKLHKNVEMAEYVSKKLLKIMPKHHGSHVFLSSMYARSKRWDDAEKIRNDMKANHINREPGWSCIVPGEIIHNFVVDKQAPAIDICNKLEIDSQSQSASIHAYH